jgi:hypothetical protein
MRLAKRYLAPIAALCLASVACGGGSSHEAEPLKTRISERYIAGLSMSEQRPVIHAEEELALARREGARAEVEYKQSATLLTVAKYEEEQAELAVRAARETYRAAQDRANKKEMRAAQSDIRWADAQQQRASTKLLRMQTRRAYLKAELGYRAAYSRAMEARYELEKARLAAAHQIEPKGFSLAEYERQFHERMAQAKSKQLRIKEKRQAANLAHDRWLAFELEAEEFQENVRAPPDYAPTPPDTSSDGLLDKDPDDTVDDQDDQPIRPPTL